MRKWILPARLRLIANAYPMIVLALMILLHGWKSPALGAEAAPQQSAPSGQRIWLQESQGLTVTRMGATHADDAVAQNLAQGQAAALSMIHGDFDEDGVTDLVVGYDSPGGGALVLHRGNLDAFAPQSQASWLAIAKGEFPSPFHNEAQVFNIPVRPDFVAAGNFTGKGHLDLVAAARGGNALYVFAGDGAGKFAAPQIVSLPGALDTLAAGNLGGAQPFTSLVAGVSGPQNGSSLWVYSGSAKGLAPSAHAALKAPASAIAFGNVDGDSQPGAVVLAEGQVLVLHSPSLQLEAVSLPVAASAMALGSFIHDRDPRAQIALLAPDGSVHIVVHSGLDPRPFTADEIGAMRQAAITGRPNPVVPSGAGLAGESWKIAETFPSVASFGNAGQVPVLLRTRVSSGAADDVMILNGQAGQMVVISHANLAEGASTFVAGEVSVRPYSGSPVTALAMRVNVDGRPGVVALHPGGASLRVMGPLPDPTFIVNTTLDTKTPGACAAATPGACSLREAIIEANASAGVDTIMVPAGTFQLTIPGANENAAQTGDLDITDGVNIIGAVDGGGNPASIVEAGATAGSGIDKVFSVNPLFNKAFDTSFSNLVIRFGNNPSSFGGDGFGGGFDWEASGTGNMTVTNCVIDSNSTTDGQGGGITATNTPGGAGVFTITNSTVSNNTAQRASPNSGTGGGLFIGSHTAFVMSNTQILGNKAVQAQSEGGGVFIFNPGTTPISAIHGGSISGNQSTVRGGGIRTTAGILIDQGAVIANNQSATGAGLWSNLQVSGPFPAGETTTLSKVTMTGNSATGNGGGIAVDSSASGNHLSISFSRIAANTAAAGSGLNNIAGTVTATDNWWGTNTPAGDIGGTVTFDPFIALTHTANPGTLVVGGNATLTASFLQDNHGAALAAGNLDVLDGLPITFGNAVDGAVSAVNGTGSNSTGTIQANGTATATFTAGTTPGTGHADAKVDSATVTASLTINPGPATHFSVSAPASAAAGVAFSFTVTAQDQFNNTATGYTGTVHFTSSDGAAVLPANATLTNGVGTFSATLKTTGSQTITATDTVNAAITGTSNAIVVGAGPATHFTVAAPASTIANVALSFTVTALDQFGNTATGYTGTVHFTSSDGAAALPANSTLTSGVGTFSATLKTTGSQTITATDTVNAAITGTSNAIAVTSGPATHFAVSVPATATAGVALNFTVTALDQGGNTAASYTGTVHFSSSDGAAALPANSTLTNGTGTFSATLKTAGSQTITATDTVNAAITGTSNAIVVSAGTATHFTVSAPATATAGVALNFTVTAQDQFNNTATGYTGTVHFSGSDGAAVLPANSTLTNGTGTFSATLKTVGSQTITATDTVNAPITGTSGAIAVSAGTATHFVVSAPATATAGVAFSFTVTAQDQFNNTATGYTGTVHFSSSDGAAVLPANSTLTNGTGTFSATLKTAGSQTITATDTVNAGITGTSGAIVVSAGTATHFVVSAPATATAGVAFSFTVTALDQGGNIAASFTGTVHFSGSDGAAVLPANSTLTNGTGTFSATLKTAGSQTITAADTVNAGITGTSGAIAVSAGAATRFVVSAPATAAAGVAFSFTVTAQDQFNNTAAGYAGTVHFSSSDGAATLPANSALTNGTGTFSATLKTVGSQTITAADTVTPAITGTSGAVVVSAGAATHFLVSAPATAAAGVALNFTVTAQDQFNNPAAGYAGTVHFSSSDIAIGVILPANSTLTNGVGTFSATLKTLGSQTITATDTVNAAITGTSNAIAVSAGQATHFAVSAPPSAIAGVAFNFTVTALDQGGNIAASYTGTVHFSGSGGAAALPANSTLTNGVGTFSATLKTAGSQTITATDTAAPAITGTSNAIAVSAGVATHLVVSAPATATAGVALSFTVTAQDQFNNTATGYAGTVQFSSSDPAIGVILPANSTLTNGTGTFSATLKTVGNQTITAKDTVTPAITGTSGAIAVSAGPATRLVVSAPATATAGVALNFTVMALDQGGNTATGYTGTVHFRSSDGTAVLPANSTLTNGVGTFPATLNTAGNQTITATDTVNAAITGTSNAITVSTTPVPTGGQGFSITPGVATMDVSPGNSGTAPLTVTIPVSPSLGSVSFSCGSTLPFGVTCSFSPGAVTQSSQVTLTIATKGVAQTASTLPRGSASSPLYAALLLPLSGLLWLGAGKKRKNAKPFLALLFLGLLALLALAGCGGGFNTATPIGSFPVTITATSSTNASAQASATIILNVQ